MNDINRGRNLGYFFDGSPGTRAGQGRDHRFVRRQGAALDLSRARCADGPRGADARTPGGASRRARRHAGRQPDGIRRIFLRLDARRRNSAAAQHPACRRHARGHRRDAACVLAVIDPSSHRDAIAIVARFAVRHVLLLDQAKDGFLRSRTRWPKPARRWSHPRWRMMPRHFSPTRRARPAGPKAPS